MFLHGFKQGSLGFRGSPIDFVRQYDLGKERTFFKDKFTVTAGFVFLNDVGAGNIGGHKIGGELYPAETQVDCLSQ